MIASQVVWMALRVAHSQSYEPNVPPDIRSASASSLKKWLLLLRTVVGVELPANFTCTDNNADATRYRDSMLLGIFEEHEILFNIKKTKNQINTWFFFVHYAHRKWLFGQFWFNGVTVGAVLVRTIYFVVGMKCGDGGSPSGLCGGYESWGCLRT